MDETARFIGAIKFELLGCRPYELEKPGVEKSFISLLYIMPVFVPAYFAPNLYTFMESFFYTLSKYITNYFLFSSGHFSLKS